MATPDDDRPRLVEHLRKLLGDSGPDVDLERLVREADSGDGRHAKFENWTATLHVVVGAILAHEGRQKAAATHLSAALAQEPEMEGASCAAFLYGVSRFALAENDWDRAVEQLALAVEEDPAMSLYVKALFEVLVAADRLEEARAVQLVGRAHFPDDAAFDRPVGRHSKTRPESLSFTDSSHA